MTIIICLALFWDPILGNCQRVKLRSILGPQRPHEHKDPTSHDFWYPPSLGPWNQNVRSLCLSVLLGSQLFFVSQKDMDPI